MLEMVQISGEWQSYHRSLQNSTDYVTFIESPYLLTPFGLKKMCYIEV